MNIEQIDERLKEVDEIGTLLLGRGPHSSIRTVLTRRVNELRKSKEQLVKEEKNRQDTTNTD